MKILTVKQASNPDEYQLCLNIRRQVFVEEQKVSAAIEIDDYESEAIHFLVSTENEAVGTGRLRLKNSYVKFERIATLKKYRGLGIGQNLMKHMQTYAQENHPRFLPAMHAQESAV